MLLRCAYLALLAVVMASQSGCCCWPCGRTWCGSQCGEIWWHEWFSHKPECCDPCTQWGDFVGPPYTRRGQYMVSGPPTSAPNNVPTEAMEPTPAEELPQAAPVQQQTYDEFGQSQRRTPVDSSRYSRTLGNPRMTRNYVR